MISALYMSLSAGLIIWLSLNVIKNRRKYKISIGDGGNRSLSLARAAQSNATEYIPITLMLMFVLEYNQAPLLLVHIAGLAFLVGRVMHARAILSESLKKRILGMKMTLFTLLGLAFVNIIYLPYSKILDIF